MLASGSMEESMQQKLPEKGIQIMASWQQNKGKQVYEPAGCWTLPQGTSNIGRARLRVQQVGIFPDRDQWPNRPKISN